MKTFIVAPSLKDYLRYVKAVNLKPSDCFYCSTKEQASRDVLTNNRRGVPSQKIVLNVADIENIPSHYR